MRFRRIASEAALNVVREKKGRKQEGEGRAFGLPKAMRRCSSRRKYLLMICRSFVLYSFTSTAIQLEKGASFMKAEPSSEFGNDRNAMAAFGGWIRQLTQGRRADDRRPASRDRGGPRLFSAERAEKIRSFRLS